METVDYKGYTINIERDEAPENPRDWDNLGTMVCFHSRYNLGDKHNLDHRDFSNWEMIRAYLEKNNDIAIILPLYLYDHSGLRIKIGSFQGLLPQGHAEFDSGQIGFIYITKEKIRKEYGVKNITKKVIERITGYIQNEVETYDQYLNGNVWGYTVNDNEEELDSCWGYYGYDHEKSGLLDSAKTNIDYELKKNGEQLKLELV